MNERFLEKARDEKVRHDTRLLADFVQIWCDGHHSDREHRALHTDGAEAGMYGRKKFALCEECEAHLAYAEKRRAYCPKDPKPFCANCDTHCYKPEEREWEREVMRYSGPRSWRKGYAIDGIKHALESRAHRRETQASAREADTTDPTAAIAADTQEDHA